MLGITNAIPATGGVSIIEFTIVDTGNTTNVLGTYQCEDGMTWDEFINSEYNIDKNFYFLHGDEVNSKKYGTEKTSWTNIAYGNDIIKAQAYGVAKGGLVWKE